MATTQNKEEKQIKELFTKLQKMYKSCYITASGYVLPEDFRSSQSGYFFCILEQKYIEILSFLFENSCGIIYIKDIAEAKDDVNKHAIRLKFISKSSDVDIYASIDNVLKSVSDAQIWHDFILDEDPVKNEEIINSLFKDNAYVDMNAIVDEKGESSVIIGKSLLPLVTEKNCSDSLRYSSYSVNDEINILIFDFQFTHFRLYMLYYYISLE